jgi:hypothetical protein
MIGTEALETLIKLALFSGYIKGEKPVSLLIAAKPESGKTELVTKFAKNKGIVLLTDATAYGIIKTFLPVLEQGRLRHIIIADLLNPLSKQRSTADSFIAFMNSLIEEGMVEIHTYAVDFKRDGIQCGLITTITERAILDRRHKWANIGFLSRMLPVSYQYTQQTAKKILESIVKREYYREKTVKLDFPSKAVTMRLPEKYARSIMRYSTTLAQAQNIYGFRYQKQFQVLLEAHALMYGRREVMQEDFEAVAKVLDFVNLKFNAI